MATGIDGARAVAGRKDERFRSDITVQLTGAEGLMRNVSASGVYFVTEADLRPGDLLEFDMEFPAAQIGPVFARCAARVVRVERIGPRNGVGAAFESIEFRRDPTPDQRAK